MTLASTAVCSVVLNLAKALSALLNALAVLGGCVSMMTKMMICNCQFLDPEAGHVHLHFGLAVVEVLHECQEISG